MAGLATLLASHANDIEAIAAAFERDLKTVIESSVQDVKKKLKDQLEVDNDKVISNVHNQAILSNIDRLLSESVNANGYAAAIQRYIDSFNGQYVAFRDVLKHINSEIEWPLPSPKFEGPVANELDAIKKTQKTLIDDLVNQSAIKAKGVALNFLGAVSPEELAKSIASQLDKSLAQAESLADTGVSTFYRAISEKGFKLIEEDLPEFKIRYTYEGPLDKLTRPFCTKLQQQSDTGKSWTRKQLDAMKNGQIPNVWLTGGGYRCRHQWIIDTRDLKQQQGKKPATKKTESKIKKARAKAKDKVQSSRLKPISPKPPSDREKAKAKQALARRQAEKKVKDRRAK